MALPLFDDETGYLPAGLHLASEAEVEERLGDIDAVIWLPPHIDTLVHDAEDHAMFIFGLHHTRKRGPLDVYPVTDQKWWDTWSIFFGRDEDKVPKGCVEVGL